MMRIPRPHLLQIARPRLPDRPALGSTIVAARGLSVELGGTQIVDHVDLELHAGEVLALVGPNGAGKSTLLAALCGDVPSTGEILIDDAPLASWTHRELAMRRAVLPQQIMLSFPFTVLDVVTMGRAPWAGTEASEEDEAIVAQAMDETDIASFVARPFLSLSGGERTLVALARVIAQQAPVLLLDEPTAALDLHHQEAVMRLVRERAKGGDAVIVVVHDLGLAAAHADTMMILSRGKTVAYGPPREVLDPSLLSHVYQHQIDVLPHPTTGAPLIVPRR